MILGIGSDLVDITRIERSIERFGDRFLARIFTDRERARADGKANRAAVYAKRFAAKEAIWKALGEEDRAGIQWRELEVVNDASGKPSFELSGVAAARLNAITPDGYVARVDLSLTDEPPMAQAFVVISAEAPGLRSEARA
jgi:holo-[acyl-carrier protein] synthase